MFIKIYLKQKIKKKQAIAVPFTIFVNWKSLFTITLYNEKKKKKKQSIFREERHSEKPHLHSPKNKRDFQCYEFKDKHVTYE